jgi:hypothetical protein
MPITVVVKDQAGRPAKGVRVCADGAGNNCLTTPDNGTVTLQTLSGNHTIYVNRKSCCSGTSPGPVKNCKVQSLDVTVTHLGAPVVGANVCLEGSGTTCSQTDSNGFVRVYDRDAGSHDVYVNGSKAGSATLPGSFGAEMTELLVTVVSTEDRPL